MCNASESMQCVPRQREMRKNEIRDYISQQLNWAGQPMPTGDQVRERVSQLPELPAWTLAPPRPRTPAPPFSQDYTERVQSFFPECKC